MVFMQQTQAEVLQKDLFVDIYYIFVAYIFSVILLRNQKLLTLIIHGTEVSFAYKKYTFCSVYLPIWVIYDLWWIIKKYLNEPGSIITSILSLLQKFCKNTLILRKFLLYSQRLEQSDQMALLAGHSATLVKHDDIV